MPEPSEAEAMFRDVYEAFNCRAIDEVLDLLDPKVDWPDMRHGGRMIGHDAVRRCWVDQFARFHTHVEPVGVFDRPGGEIVVVVHHLVCDLEGDVLIDMTLRHVYTVRAGLIVAMDVEDLDGTLLSAPRDG
jgi:hypothetical protein